MNNPTPENSAILSGMLYKHWPNLRYAVIGLRLAWKEPHFRIHIGVSVIVVLLSFLFNISALEFAVLLLAVGTVMVAEIFNTALEELCDKHTKEHDPHIARIKDLAAAAVLVASAFAGLVGILIFLPYAYVSF
jgi:diacylglycerol kinase